MAEALPDGYVDTGITVTLSMSGDCAVMMARDPGNTRKVSLGDWELEGLVEVALDISCVEGPIGTRVSGHYRAYARWGYRNLQFPVPSDTVAEEISINCATIGTIPGVMSEFQSLTQSVGPYRLGVRLTTISGYESEAPHFAVYDSLEYAWFVDENTTKTSTFAGETAPTLYALGTGWALTQNVGMDPVEISPEGLGISATVNANNLTSSTIQAQFENLNVNGSADTTGLASGGVLFGLGGGSAEAYGTGGGGATLHAPYQLSYDIDLPLFGSETSSEASFSGAIVGAQVAPYTAILTYSANSWQDGIPSSYEALTLTESDADLFPANDLAIPLWAAPAREDPGSIDQYYQPVTVALATSLDVHRPDAATPSSFVASGALAVTENATTTVFSVSGSGAYARREFGATGTDLPEWRPWLGVGASGHGDAAFNPDLSHTTKHSSGADIFDWTSYRYLRVNISAPSAGTLTLTVEGVYLDISDPHTTGSDRPDNFSVTETPYTAVYTFDVASGANEIDLDLCFPVAGGPFYHGRVEAIKLSGFAVGSYTLSGINLVSLATRSVSTLGGVASVKAGVGAPVQRGDYSALHASHNGANPTLNLGDTSNKPEEIGAHGGALRFVNILTGAESGIIQDSQLSLQTFWEQLNSLEGWTVTWSQAAHDAANEDSFGNALSAGIAEWSRPGLLSLTAGGSLSPKCHPVVRRINVVPGYAFAIYTRHPVYGAVEAIATQGSGPAPAASSVTYGGVTATTDSHGFVSFPGVPTGTALLSHSGTLTPRDRVRVLVSVPSTLGGVTNLAVPLVNWYLEAWIENGVRFGFAPWVTPPFQFETQVTANDADGHPELYHRRGRTVLLWQRGTSSPSVYRAYSDDWGRTWNPAEVAFVGGKYPRATVCPQTLTVLEFAYLGGAIVARRQTPGESTPGAVFYPSGIGAIADEPFDVDWHGDGRRSLLLVVNDGAAVRRYRSTDQGNSFTLVV